MTADEGFDAHRAQLKAYLRAQYRGVRTQWSLARARRIRLNRPARHGESRNARRARLLAVQEHARPSWWSSSG